MSELSEHTTDRTWPTAKVAVGVADGYYRKTVINLDTETHEEVAAGAKTNRCSFAAQARMLIEVGLETLKADEVARRAA